MRTHARPAESPGHFRDLYLLAKRYAEAVFRGGDAARRRRHACTLALQKEPVMQILKSLFVAALLIGSLLLGMLVAAANACTGIRLTAADGSVVQARTMEFGLDMDSNVIVVPRGYERTGTTPDGKPGTRWSSKYACVGANGVGLPIMLDGVNEKGLSAGLFYFPGSAGYMPYSAADADQTLAPWELGSWILENCATVGGSQVGRHEAGRARGGAETMGLLPGRALRRGRRQRGGDCH